MTERERKLDALWWLLFDALGYVAGVDESGEGTAGRLISPDGTEMICRDAGSFIQFYWNIPDWPTDAGAALVLCNKIAAKHEWSLVFEHCGGDVWYWFKVQPDPRDGPEHKYCTTSFNTGYKDAEALSRLALAAKRGE